MIDRKARDAMSEAIQSYMDNKIASLKFDDTLDKIASATQDESVRAIQKALWFYYSDVEDHKIRATKQQWDYYNRFRLVLASDVEAEWYRAGRHWNAYRTLSAVGVVGLGLVALMAGFGKMLIVCWILAGFLASAILWVWNRNDRKAWAPTIPIFPFPSVKFLLSVRRRVGNFARTRYPKSMARKANLHRYLDKMMLILRSPLWLAFAPLALLFMALPIRQQEMRLKTPVDSV